MLITWHIVKLVLVLIVVFNEIAALITVFRERRDIAATWAWLLVLTLMPVVGFIFYSFLGRKLPQRRLERIQTETQLELSAALDKQKAQFLLSPPPKQPTLRTYKRTIMLFQSIDDAFLTRHNHVDLFSEGHHFFGQLLKDIAAAKHSIHIEFYTIYNDRIGNQLRTVLEQKAAAGVEVRVLYDSWGSMGVKPSFYDGLRANGGHAAPFLLTRSNLFDFRLNYRDHRKIVVLDGKVGYVGGFNVGDQYLGRLAKFGHWRDTHLRIVGSGVYGLQQRFIRDWNASTKEVQQRVDHYRPYFPKIKVGSGTTALQIVSSGPDSPLEEIKLRTRGLMCGLWCPISRTMPLCTGRPSTTPVAWQRRGLPFTFTKMAFCMPRRWWWMVRWPRWARRIWTFAVLNSTSKSIALCMIRT